VNFCDNGASVVILLHSLYLRDRRRNDIACQQGDYDVRDRLKRCFTAQLPEWPSFARNVHCLSDNHFVIALYCFNGGLTMFSAS